MKGQENMFSLVYIWEIIKGQMVNNTVRLLGNT